MSNKYKKRTHISERQFRQILKGFALDIPALTISKMTSVSRNTLQKLYTELRVRIAYLALEEIRPFVGEIEVDESDFGPSRIRGKFKGKEAVERAERFRFWGCTNVGNTFS